jgi:hypothetical protein
VKKTRTIAVAVFGLLALCETGPASAYGQYEDFLGRNSVNPMVYLHVPLNSSTAEGERPSSFGFRLRSEFLFGHPEYQGERGPYSSSTSTTFNLMDLRFGMNGKLSGFDVGGLTALGAKARQ